jgi:anti-sigma factor RsiW
MSAECTEYHQLVTAAVDNRLEHQEREALETHLHGCGQCRREFELQSLTKTFLANRTTPLPTPHHVREGICRNVLQMVPSAEGTSWIFSQQRFVRPAFAIGVACLALLLWVMNPSPNVEHTQAGFSSDVIFQSLANYRGVIAGDITPQVVSERNDEVRSFFTDKTTFPVLVPRIKDCTLLGGVLNEHAGFPLAHLLYRHGDDIIYVYQACWETIQQGKTLYLDASICDQLNRTGWYSMSGPEDQTVVLWLKGRTLCAAVSRLTREDLIACLTAVE